MASERINCILIFMALLAGLSVLSGCTATTERVRSERQQAVSLYQQGQYPQAIQELEDLVKRIPKDSELRFRLGNAYAKNGQPEKAIESYRSALLRNPELGKAWYNMGLIHMQEGLKAFIDMEKFVSETDPALEKAAEKREGLLLLLGGQEKEKNE